MERHGAILVVDDSEFVREPLAISLEIQGHRVTQAIDGFDALEKLHTHPFDVILLDLMMPGMDGYEVLQRLKADAQLRHIPVVMISAVDDLDLVARCIKAGAEDYLFKPYSEVLLKARVDASLERKAWHDQEQLYLQQIREEQEKAEHLLLNILPEPITARLKQGEQLIADSFAEVTIMFADIADFTQISAHLPPADTVSLLDAMFTTFDDMVEASGLEKIKTIGDAYLVAGGLPTWRPDHAQVVSDLALRMQDAVTRFHWPSGDPVEMRIGISTGPIVAGVIGRKKFAYDIWGDAVNTADRMQLYGLPRHIHVSQTTYEKLKDAYRFEARDTIFIKGKGKMTTYFLVGKRD